ncbi:hypothetical protein DY000_02004854 [Brassica cretica]|uniref:Auxin-responsive protein n=1 Tax=Brassica cretica TaxID=69181 RepID=A0ABQ7CIX9_BRACR|nr:hypothetical protein DY000_02004854 [Brassica cretica]
MVIKKRRDGFTYGSYEKRGKPLSLQYSLEELQTMVDDMDYGLRSEPLVGGCFEYNIGMGLKSEDLCNEGEKAVPYDYLDMSSGSDWDQFLRKWKRSFIKRIRGHHEPFFHSIFLFKVLSPCS